MKGTKQMLAGVVSAATLLAGVVAVPAFAEEAPAGSATAPTYAVNTEFNGALQAFINEAKSNPNRWCSPEAASNGVATCTIIDPKDSGILDVSDGYQSMYNTTGYLSEYNYTLNSAPDRALNIQTYRAKIEPGHYGYLFVSNLAGTNCPAPITVATHGNTAADGSAEEGVFAARLGGSILFDSANSQSSFKDWIMSTDADSNAWAPTGQHYLKGDQLFLQHITYGGGGAGSACGGGDTDNSEWLWINTQNQSQQASDVYFTLAAPDADKVTYHTSADGSITTDYSQNKLRVTYLDSPVELKSDVTAFTSHVGDINWLIEQNISTGMSDGSFGVGHKVQRQDMAAFLRRVARNNNVSDAASWKPSDADWSKFRDVNSKTPHAEDILWLAHAGITTGYSDGTFAGGAGVQRQDMAAFLHRLAKLAGKDGAEGSGKSFTDVHAGTPHAEDISWLSGTGITTGYADGSFGVGHEVQRQDMAAFLHRLDSNILK